MQQGQHKYATRKAHELFDAWNDITGVFPKFNSYYYEILAVIEDAVRVGSMVALGIEFKIKDGEIIIQAEEAVEHKRLRQMAVRRRKNEYRRKIRKKIHRVAE